MASARGAVDGRGAECPPPCTRSVLAARERGWAAARTEDTERSDARRAPLVADARIVQRHRGRRRVREQHRGLDQVGEHVKLLVVGDGRIGGRLLGHVVVGDKVRGEDDVRADEEDAEKNFAGKRRAQFENTLAAKLQQHQVSVEDAQRKKEYGVHAHAPRRGARTGRGGF